MRRLINEKDQKDKELDNLEGGFNLYVNGAHKTPEKYTPRHLVAATKTPKNVPKLDLNYVLALDKSVGATSERNACLKSVPNTRRKHWGNSSVIIKTMDGCKIKLSSKNKYNFNSNETDSFEFNENYSDDFDSDSSNDQMDGTPNKKCNKQKARGLIANVEFFNSSPSESDDEKCQSFSVKYDRKTFEQKFLRNSYDIEDVRFK